MQAIEIEAPIDLNGNIHLPEQYHHFYGKEARLVILLPDTPPQPAAPNLGTVHADASSWPEIDPARDLAKFIGVSTGFPEDGVAYQRQIRDTEWP
ncbi:MAG TPA: hypothetical protein VJ001_07940 [Rhodocyclaceae bacterium]|nr:hypothetical protein [Rhodocyclaceae bacterium]